MSIVARRILGMSKKEIFNYDFPSAKSIDETFGTTHRNVCVFAGMIAGTPQDRNPERKKFKRRWVWEWQKTKIAQMVKLI
mgnify:FL=1